MSIVCLYVCVYVRVCCFCSPVLQAPRQLRNRRKQQQPQPRPARRRFFMRQVLGVLGCACRLSRKQGAHLTSVLRLLCWHGCCFRYAQLQGRHCVATQVPAGPQCGEGRGVSDWGGSLAVIHIFCLCSRYASRRLRRRRWRIREGSTAVRTCEYSMTLRCWTMMSLLGKSWRSSRSSCWRREGGHKGR